MHLRLRQCLALSAVCRQAKFEPVTGPRLREFLDLLMHSMDSEVETDPAKLGPAVSDQMDQAKASVARGALLGAEETVTRAINLARNGRQGDALQEWRKLFGPLFPLS